MNPNLHNSIQFALMITETRHPMLEVYYTHEHPMKTLIIQNSGCIWLDLHQYSQNETITTFIRLIGDL